MRKRSIGCSLNGVCVNEYANWKTKTNDASQIGDGVKPTIQQIPTKEITPVVPPAYPLRETYDKTFQTLSGVEDDITTDFDDASFDLGGEDEEDKEAPGAQSREK